MVKTELKNNYGKNFIVKKRKYKKELIGHISDIHSITIFDNMVIKNHLVAFWNTNLWQKMDLPSKQYSDKLVKCDLNVVRK
jgi:hypothetical protein